MEITQDPTVIIEHRDPYFLIYSNTSGERWIIWGQCTHNGSCIDGAVNPDLRPYDKRLDCPVRPEIECNGCDLRGEYL